MGGGGMSAKQTFNYIGCSIGERSANHHHLMIMALISLTAPLLFQIYTWHTPTRINQLRKGMSRKETEGTSTQGFEGCHVDKYPITMSVINLNSIPADIHINSMRIKWEVDKWEKGSFEVIFHFLLFECVSPPKRILL